MYNESTEGVSVHDGFPNPAADTSFQPIDLNSLLISHSAATFLMRLSGNEWEKLGLFDGDILIVDRSFKPRGNDLVIWWESEGFKINPKHKVPVDTPVWGVVTSAIHQFGKDSE